MYTKTNIQTRIRNKHNIARNTRRTLHKRYYESIVVDYFDNPKNAGEFEDSDNRGDIGTGFRGHPSCGDVLQFQIQVENDKVVDAKFLTFGCGSAVASSALASEMVVGKTLDECLEIKNADIAGHLKLPPVKKHCSDLAEDAIKLAVYNYKKKNTPTEAANAEVEK